MGRVSSIIFSPTIHFLDGSVVAIRNERETYITACEDRTTVTLEKKLQGSNNGQYWTVKVVRDSDGSLTGRFNLKSIYGTFLGARLASSKWFGIVKKYEVCQTSMLEKDDGLSPPFYVHCCVVSRSSKTPLNWYDLQIRYYYSGSFYETLFLVPEEGRRLRLIDDFPPWELWHIQVVDNDKSDTSPNKEQQRPTPTPAPAPSTSALVPTLTPTRNPPSSGTKILSHDLRPPMRQSVKLADKYLVINFNNQMGGDGPSSLYNAGNNTNGSGTQKNGDIDVRNEVGRYDNLKFQFNFD